MNPQNLWAPWRLEYLKTIDTQDAAHPNEPCFFCRYAHHPENDRANLVLWRSAHCMVLMNRFPYTGGHLLIAPMAHGGSMNALDETTLLEWMLLTRDAQTILSQTIYPHGFNVGININRCAGAGVPDHIHLHIVPRWEGDTNFMSVCGDIRVISQGLDDLYQQLKTTGEKLGLPQAP